MVLISQSNEVVNFDNLVSIRPQGPYIHAKTVYGGDITFGAYKTAERAAEVMEAFINDMFDTPWTMIGRYAFPTE